MSAQAGRTTEITADWQVTPVIIKSGGGDEGPDQVAGHSPVTINLENKAFESPLKDDEWRRAESTVTAGIISLEIQDGDKNVGVFTGNPRLEGIRLQVIYGRNMLVFDNEALPEPHRTRLVITSAIPFKVIKKGDSVDQWIESRASYPADKPLVIFTQGGDVFANYQCQTDDVTLTLNLDWDETGG